MTYRFTDYLEQKNLKHITIININEIITNSLLKTMINLIYHVILILPSNFMGIDSSFTDLQNENRDIPDIYECENLLNIILTLLIGS